MDNKINFSIPDEAIAQVKQKLAEITTIFKPYLIALTPAERQAIPKMSDKTVPFVEKTLDYCTSAPQFAPSFMDREALAADMKVVNQLIPVFRIVKQLSDGLDDTSMEAGAESYVNALAYYNSVKLAAKNDVPGAKAIYEDLSKRFVKASSGNGSSPEPAN